MHNTRQCFSSDRYLPQPHYDARRSRYLAVILTLGATLLFPDYGYADSAFGYAASTLGYADAFQSQHRRYDLAAVSPQPEPDVTPAPAQLTDYELIYDAFVASGELDDAERTAEQALANGLPAAVWAPRLAQIAQWNNHLPTAMEYWVVAAQASGDSAMWRNAYTLAEQLADVGVQIQALSQLAALRPNDVTFAMQLARLRHGQGRSDLAVAGLQEAVNRGHVADSNVEFWRLYSQLAYESKQATQADDAFRRLLSAGQADAMDLQRMELFYADYPLDAGRLAELEFDRTGEPAALRRALYSYQQANADERISALLQKLTPAQRSELESSSDFLLARSHHRMKQGQFEAGLEDLRRAVALPDADDRARIAYLWGLVDFGTERELREAMGRMAALAPNNPEYWGAMGAGSLRIGESLRAVRYLRGQRLTQGDDPLWLMALASAEESAGYTERARNLRREARQLLAKAPPTSSDAPVDEQGDTDPTSVTAESAADPNGAANAAAASTQADMARILLAGEHTTADYPRALLAEMLRLDMEPTAATSTLGDLPNLPPLPKPDPTHQQAAPGPVARQTMLAWVLAKEEYPLARVWLATHYTNQRPPPDARLAVALGENNTEELTALLQQEHANLPIDGRVQALIRTGQIAEAQTLAYQAAQGAPDSQGRHEVLTGTLAMSGERPFVGSDIVFSDSEPLRYLEATANGFVKLNQRFGVGVEATHREQRSTNENVLA